MDCLYKKRFNRTISTLNFRKLSLNFGKLNPLNLQWKENIIEHVTDISKFTEPPEIHILSRRDPNLFRSKI